MEGTPRHPLLYLKAIAACFGSHIALSICLALALAVFGVLPDNVGVLEGFMMYGWPVTALLYPWFLRHLK